MPQLSWQVLDCVGVVIVVAPEEVQHIALQSSTVLWATPHHANVRAAFACNSLEDMVPAGSVQRPHLWRRCHRACCIILVCVGIGYSLIMSVCVCVAVGTPLHWGGTLHLLGLVLQQRKSTCVPVALQV